MVQSGREKEVGSRLLSKCGGSIKELLIPEPIISEVISLISEEEEDDKIRYKDFTGYMFLKTRMSDYIYGAVLSIENIYKFLGTIQRTEEIKQNVPSQIPD